MQSLVVAGDELAQAIKLFLLADVFDSPHHFFDPHPLVDEVLLERLEACFALVKCSLEVLYRERHRPSELLHQLVELLQTSCKVLKLVDEGLYLGFRVVVGISKLVSTPARIKLVTLVTYL